MTNAVSATPYSGMGRRRSCGMMNQIQKITITSGTPRKNSTYIVAGTRVQGDSASREAEEEAQDDGGNPQPQRAADERADADQSLEHQELEVGGDDGDVHGSARLRPGDQPGDRVRALHPRHDRRNGQRSEERR